MDSITDHTKIQAEPFREDIVNEYLSDKGKFSKFPLRHYSQLEVSFDPPRIGKLFDRLRVPTNITAIIFGGYTGHFAVSLRAIGMRVIFTDPLEEWVTNAKQLGFEAYQLTAGEITGNLLARTDIVATFECYLPFTEKEVYTTLRFLSTRYGLLFAESRRTREELRSEGASGGMKLSFLPYSKVYSLTRVYREQGDLRLYRYYPPDSESMRKLQTDAHIMKAIHDFLPHEGTIRASTVSSFPSISGMGRDSVASSLERIMHVHYYECPPSLRFLLWTAEIWIGDKRFMFDKALLSELET